MVCEGRQERQPNAYTPRVLPLRDLNRSTRTPVVNWILIGINAALFFYELTLGPRLEGFMNQAAFIPGRFFDPGIGPGPVGELSSALLSMFLHGGWGHIIGNSLYLWVFGNNVEDSMGRMRFLAFYIITGLAAAAAHIVVSPASPIPTVGASGAISGIMGAYLVLYPRVSVRTSPELLPPRYISSLCCTRARAIGLPSASVRAVTRVL